MTLMVENSWSPMETRMRLCIMLDLGRPSPLCNMPIFDHHGQLLGTPDLFDAELGLAMEYDSALHLTTSRRARDIERETMFRDHGIETVAVVSTDVAGTGGATKKLLAAINRAERSLPYRRPRWTLEQPWWWRPTHTVKQRRALLAAGLGHLLPSRRYVA